MADRTVDIKAEGLKIGTLEENSTLLEGLRENLIRGFGRRVATSVLPTEVNHEYMEIYDPRNGTFFVNIGARTIFIKPIEDAKPERDLTELNVLLSLPADRFLAYLNNKISSGLLALEAVKLGVLNPQPNFETRDITNYKITTRNFDIDGIKDNEPILSFVARAVDDSVANIKAEKRRGGLDKYKSYIKKDSEILDREGANRFLKRFSVVLVSKDLIVLERPAYDHVNLEDREDKVIGEVTHLDRVFYVLKRFKKKEGGFGWVRKNFKPSPTTGEEIDKWFEARQEKDKQYFKSALTNKT